MQNNLLIIFIKNTIKGKVKTRLAKDIGDDKALEVYKELLNHTHLITSRLDLSKEVYYDAYIENNDIWKSTKYNKSIQHGDDLGSKMSFAFEQGFKAKKESICIIGSDCYDLTSSIIEKAFEQLKTFDFVIGPANDGGYYLLGMNQYHPQLFDNKIYSTDTVLDDAIHEIKSLNKSYCLLPKLTDIDNINDLKKFQ